MNYLQFNFEINNETPSDSLLAVLAVNNFEGFEETNDCLKAFIPEALFDETYISTVKDIFPSLKFQKTTVEQINWNAEWEANFHPVIIDEFAGIRAHFHPALKNVKHEIIITPKMSFGTGHHATTFMMIQLMQEIEFNDKSVVDFGTGTGVLAILAKKTGASTLVAIDHDEWSIENAKENFTMNSAEAIRLVKMETLPGGETFDIVLANINLNIILLNMQALAKATKEKGIILLSGFLSENLPVIKEALNLNGLSFISSLQNNNWIAVKAQKNP